VIDRGDGPSSSRPVDLRPERRVVTRLRYIHGVRVGNDLISFVIAVPLGAILSFGFVSYLSASLQ